MTLGDLAKKARFQTNSDISSYPDANLLIDINVWYQKIVTMILESADGFDFDDNRATDYPVQTTLMVANQRDYTMPVSEKVLKIKRVDLSYNGTDWYRAVPFDSGEWSGGIGFDQGSSTNAVFDQNFDRTAPRYDVAYNSLWLMPMPVALDVTNGGIIRVEWERNVTAFTSSDYSSVLTDSTVVPGIDGPFQPMLADGPALEFAKTRQLPQLAVLQQQMADWEMRLRQHYGRKSWDRTLQMTPYIDQTYGR